MPQSKCVNVLLRYNPEEGILRGLITFPQGVFGLDNSGKRMSAGGYFGGSKIVSVDARGFRCELVDPSYEDFANLGVALGGKDSVKALRGMACQVTGKDVLVAMLSIS